MRRPAPHRAFGRCPGAARFPIVRHLFAALAKRPVKPSDGACSRQTSQTASRRVIPWALGLGLGLFLSACGGGDKAAGPVVAAGPQTPLGGSATGVLTDAAVQGVAYTTSSGVTGTTDAQGQFTYTPNDTVSFKLGAVVLGSVPAAGLVTPLELAAGNADKLQNLLVLLQSLDDDGIASNGIKIAPAAAVAVSASVDLAQAAAAFASSANTGLTAAMAAGGISRAITSTSQATAHFLDQSKALLSSQVWVGSFDNGAYVVVQRFGPGGELLHADIGAAEGGGMSGLEYGTALASAVDARGFELAPTFEIDTNGTWGLSHLSACERVSVTGGQLTYLEAPASCVTGTSTPLAKADNDPNGIVGVWNFGSAELVKSQTFVFWANGKFAMLDPIGDTANNCGGPGVEYGTYAYDATSKAFKVLSVSVDTNGCAGLNDSTAGAAAGMASFSLTLSSDGKTGTAVFSDSSDQIFRVSR